MCFAPQNLKPGFGPVDAVVLQTMWHLWSCHSEVLQFLENWDTM